MGLKLHLFVHSGMHRPLLHVRQCTLTQNRISLPEYIYGLIMLPSATPQSSYCLAYQEHSVDRLGQQPSFRFCARPIATFDTHTLSFWCVRYCIRADALARTCACTVFFPSLIFISRTTPIRGHWPIITLVPCSCSINQYPSALKERGYKNKFLRKTIPEKSSIK